MTKYNLQSFRVDRQDFLKGNNAYDNFPSGGFLNSTVGINAFSKPGLLAQPPVIPTAVTTTSPGTGFCGFASGYNGSGQGTKLGMYVDSATNYAYWTLINSTGSHNTPTSDTGGRTYNFYQSDLAWYQGSFYGSGTATLAQINASNSTVTATWLTSQTDTRTGIAAVAMTSNVPHPLLVFEDILYIADGQYLNKLDGAVYTSQVFDLPAGYSITAMVEYRGMIYMFASQITLADGSTGDLPSHGKSKLYSWDGLQDSWFEEYDLDYPVYSACVWKNRIYAFTKYAMTYWNGSDLYPIWPVSNKVYKHQITTVSDSLFFADGTSIIRYGRPHGLPGENKFYKYLDAAQTGVSYAGITSFYNQALVISERNTASKTYYISNIDTPTTGATSKIYDFNTRYMKAPVKLRQVVIETEALTTDQIVKCGYTNDQGVAVYPTNNSGEFKNATTAMAGKKRWKFDFHSVDATREVTPKIILTAGVHLKNVEYYYEASEIGSNS